MTQRGRVSNIPPQTHTRELRVWVEAGRGTGQEILPKGYLCYSLLAFSIAYQLVMCLDCPGAGPGPLGPGSRPDRPPRSGGPGQHEGGPDLLLEGQVQLLSGLDLRVGPGGAK